MIIFNLKFIWSFIAIAIMIAATLLTNAPPLVAVATLTGIVFVLGVAFKKNWAPLFGAVLSVLYAILSYKSGFFANAALNLIVLTPLQLWGWYHWIKQKDTVYEISSKFKKWIGILTVVGMAIMTAVSIHSRSNLPFLDGPSSVLVVTATLLLSLKVKDQWYAWIPYNIIECIMWFFAMSLEPSVLAIFAMRAVFLINSLIGAKEWSTK